MSRRAKNEPASETYLFVGVLDGGAVPLSDVHLVLDANVVSQGESIVQKGHDPSVIDRRRFAHLAKWISQRPRVDFHLLPGAMERANFDEHGPNPYKLYTGLQGVEWLINACKDNPEIDFFSGLAPAELMGGHVDMEELEESMSQARAYYVVNVLPNYALLAKWRLLTGGDLVRGRRTAAESVALLREISDWMTDNVGFVPSTWWLLCLAEFGTLKTRQTIYEGMLKFQKPDVAKTLGNAAGDAGLISYVSFLQTLRDQEAAENGAPPKAMALVTDDEKFADAFGLLFSAAGRPDVWRSWASALRPECEAEFRQLELYRSRAAGSRPRREWEPDIAVTGGKVLLTVQALQQELSLPVGFKALSDQDDVTFAPDREETARLLDALLSDESGEALVARGALFSDWAEIQHLAALAEMLVGRLGGKDEFHALTREAVGRSQRFDSPEDLDHELRRTSMAQALYCVRHYGANDMTMRFVYNSVHASPERWRVARSLAALCYGLLRIWGDKEGVSRDGMRQTVLGYFPAPSESGGPSEQDSSD